MTTATAIDTKAFSARALKAELTRRSQPRNERSRAKSWVFVAMTKPEIKSVLAGETIRVNFNSGRVVDVSLKS